MNNSLLSKDTLIIIPAYNEEKRIENTLREYLKTGFNILVVFDGNDNTDKIVSKYAKDGVYLLKFNRRLGKGGAISQGIKWALENGYRYAIIADADGSISYKYLIEIRRYLEENEFIYTIRTMRNYPIIRKILSKLYLLYNWLILPELFLIKDIQSGYKGFGYRFMKDFINNSIITGFAFDSNLFLVAKRHKHRIKGIKVNWKYNEDSVFGKKMFKNVLRMGLSVIKLRIYFSPFRFVLKYLRGFDEKLRKILQ